jgi:hypothetical protein
MKGGDYMDNASELGRVKRDDQVDIVIRKGEFMGKAYVDIREYLKAESFEGFTKRGIRIPADLYAELVAQMNKS